jgi:hypothetical protein
MQSAATINDAARRLEEASAVFRMKSRSAQEEYDELRAQWNDARARQFNVKHLEPQRDLMEQGARLCQLHATLVDAARAAAQESEQEISSFFASQSNYESAAESARHTTSATREQADRAKQDFSRVLGELRTINAAIRATAADPGW